MYSIQCRYMGEVMWNSSFKETVSRGFICIKSCSPYLVRLCSTVSDTPQDFVMRGISPRMTLFLRGIRPQRTSVCSKMYTTLPLLCSVWHPARLSNTWTDTLQIKTPRNQTKKFWELASPLKGLFSKLSACIIFTSQDIHNHCIKTPSLKIFIVLRGIRPHKNQLSDLISTRIWNRIQKYFRVWIRGAYEVNSCKKKLEADLVLLYL